MSERWTPGPWTVFNSEQIAPADARLGDPTVAIIAIRDKEEQRANARLIAQSPAMLASLKALIKGIDEWNEAAQQIIGRIPDYEWGDLEEARRVVTKARGEESA